MSGDKEPPPGWYLTQNQNLHRPYSCEREHDVTHSHETEGGAVDEAWKKYEAESESEDNGLGFHESGEWWGHKREVTIHKVRVGSDHIEIEEVGSGFSSTDDREWPILKWTAYGSVTCTGHASSLERAKADSLAALELLAERTFDTGSGPQDDSDA